MQKQSTKYEYDQTVIVFGRAGDPQTIKRRKKATELAKKMECGENVSKMWRDILDGKILLTRLPE